MTPDVNVVLLNLPTNTSEAVTENPDGSYTTIINSRLSNERQLKAYEHAMKHIENNDFKNSDVQAIEYVAHSNATPEKKPEIMSSADYLERLRNLRSHRRKTRQALREYESSLKISDFLNNDALLDVARNQYLYGE
jgi:hypothetical protein